MSAINLRDVKREFSELNYRPDVCHPRLVNELKDILETTGLGQQYGTALGDFNTRSFIDIIKNVCKVCYADDCSKEMAIEVFVFLAKMYTEHCVDDNVKRTLTKCFKSCPKRWESLLSTAVSCQFVLIVENEYNMSETEHILKMLNECCEQFPSFVSDCIGKAIVFFELNLELSYSVLICESSPTQKISAIRCIHEGLRFFLAAYRKHLFVGTLDFSNKISNCFVNLLDSDSLPMETLFNCCLSIIYIYQNVMSAIECWKMCVDKLSTRSPLIKLGFCIAILNTFTSDELRIIVPDNEKSICTNLYNIIMETSSRNLNDSSILVSSSRVFLVLSKRMYTNSEISLEKQELDCWIAFLWTRLDHFLDSVRHLSRDTMINIIKIKDEHTLNKILVSLSTCDQNSKAFLIVLTILSDKVDTELIMKYLPNISDNLFQLMISNNSAITTYINLMLNHYSLDKSKQWFEYWLCPLFKNPDILDVKHFEQIISKAIELNPDVSKHINNLSDTNEFSLKICLICFNIEKKRYLISNHNSNWMNQTTFETLKKALHSNDENIRYMAVNLILDCPKKTQLFTEKELELLKYFIIYNNKNEKASVRHTHLGFVKKMLLRMKESQFSVAVRNNESLRTAVTEYYTVFQFWFSNFCFQNLFLDATFSRRYFCLESLSLIQTCLTPLDILRLNKFKNVEILMNCLWDTYEQNKILAKDILIYKNKDSIKLDTILMEDMLKKSKILASSTSPPDSITAGYIFEVVISLKQNSDYEEYANIILTDLLSQLKEHVRLANTSITLASSEGPMYGLIHTIRHLLNTLNWSAIGLKTDWTNFLEDISKVCLECIKIVSVVVNDSSPEGIVPMDDLCESSGGVTSQMILLCCWRTTKESSLLLSDIVGIIVTQESEFSNSLITDICSCLTLLLSETKHRGAFEQIYVAFLKVCSVMWKSPSLHKMPLKCLEDVLAEIKTGLGETFCITRRSAGMPFIIQALICTNHDKRKIVDYTMETLISICENKNITQDLETGVVHAQNVLRALFRCSQLGDLVGPFVSRAINISIILFNSTSWPIRNSSTLLLSAIVNRVFGVSRSSTELSWKNRMTGREFFQRYPELYDTFLKEFKKFSPLDMNPSLYPTLLILARLYPSVNEATDCVFPLAVYIPFIFNCAQSPVMKTRMLAATSIAPQVTQNKLVDHLNITFNELSNKHLEENTIHGLFLQVFSLVENLPKLMVDDLKKLVILIEDLIAKYEKFTNCSLVVQEIFLRCITCLWLQLDDLHYDSIKPLYMLTLNTITTLGQPNAIGYSKFVESATLFLFSICLKTGTDFAIIVHNIISSKVHSGTIFKILSVILSEKPFEFCDDLDKFKSLKYWNLKMLMDQLMYNEGLIELVCQQCTVIDSKTDVKYLVLSNFTPALHYYFNTCISIDDFILKLFDLRRDTEIAHAVLCINNYINSLKSLEQSVISQLTQVFENIYYAQQSDDCKTACIDTILNNYDLFFKNKDIDIKIFLKLWTIIIRYSEDDSEDVRNHVWCLVNTDANCSKSFELLFDKFAEYFDQYPSAVLTALIFWSYLDIEPPQDQLQGQVFDSGDTSKFKEHTIRQQLALNTIVCLTDRSPQSMSLELNICLHEWILEEWTYNVEDKPSITNLSNVGDFMTYAKDFYKKIISSPMTHLSYH